MNSKSKLNEIKVTLVKSLIGRKPKHVSIAKQLRLNKINSSTIVTITAKTFFTECEFRITYLARIKWKDNCFWKAEK